MLASTATHAVRVALSNLPEASICGAARKARLREGSSAVTWDVSDMVLAPWPPNEKSASPDGCRGGAQISRLGLDGRIDRHARAQLAGEGAGIEHDLHRNALDNFGEITCGVVGRQQCKFLTARRCDAVDVAVEGDARKGVDRDRDRLARTDVRELRLLVVG